MPCSIADSRQMRDRERPYSNEKSRFSAEGESEDLHAGIEELDGEIAILDRTDLPDELIQALPVDHALAVGGDIGAVILLRRGAIDRDPEADRFAVRRRPENQMQIASVKTIDDLSARLIERGVLAGVG